MGSSALLLEGAGLPPPVPRPEVPRIITFQRKRANRRILNEDEFIELLKGYGELQVHGAVHIYRTCTAAECARRPHGTASPIPSSLPTRPCPCPWTVCKGRRPPPDPGLHSHCMVMPYRAPYRLPLPQVVEYNSSSSLYEQLLQMRRTGVYISVHTSNLANSPLMQPGSAVFEVIQVGWWLGGCAWLVAGMVARGKEAWGLGSSGACMVGHVM